MKYVLYLGAIACLMSATSCDQSSLTQQLHSTEPISTDPALLELYEFCYGTEWGDRKNCGAKISKRFDQYLLGVLNESYHPPVNRLRRLLRDVPKQLPRPEILYCDFIQGSTDILLAYNVQIWASTAASRIRIAKRNGGKYEFLYPSERKLRLAEQELGVWRGGDLQVRYGPPFRARKVRLEAYPIMRGPRLLPNTTGVTRLWAGYVTPSTCPSDWLVLWEYDGNELYPSAYAWNAATPKEWVPFGETPLAKLSEVVSRISTWEEK